jgi:16S rRNA (guanine(966)-N(2))-methyltransferase RsmD
MDIRPTSDRLRETLFNVLSAGNPEALAGTVWLDLFAGTGAVGIEALSRGAAQVYFVESSASAADAIRKNLQSLGVGGGYQIIRQELPHALRGIEADHVAADRIFLDPPYRMKEEYIKTLEALSQSKLIGTGSVVVAEHEKQFDPGEAFGDLGRFRILVQGSTTLSFYRLFGEKL